MLRIRLPLALLVLAGCGKDPDPTPTSTTPTGDTADTTTTTTTTPTGDTGPILAPPLELCINEFMPSNARSWQDDLGAYPDWIELHNPGNTAVDLLGWSLTDDRSDRTKHVFTTSLEVPAGGFLVLAADAFPEDGDLHLSFSLAEEGEEVALFREDGSAEIVSYGAVVTDVAVVRETDCGPIDLWTHVFEGTPGASNTGG